MPDRWPEGSPSTFRAVANIGEQFIGLFAFVLAVILFRPIPFGNTVPALAIAIMALAVLEWHGLAAISGTPVCVAGLAVVSGVVVGLMKGAIFIVQSFNRSIVQSFNRSIGHSFIKPIIRSPYANRLQYPQASCARNETVPFHSI